LPCIQKTLKPHRVIRAASRNRNTLAQRADIAHAADVVATTSSLGNHHGPIGRILTLAMFRDGRRLPHRWEPQLAVLQHILAEA